MTQQFTRRRLRGVLAAGAAASTLLVGGLVAATGASAASLEAESSQQSGAAEVSTAASALPGWPSADGEQKVDDTIEVDGTLDGGMTRYYGIAEGDQGESQPAMFELSDGETLKNVIIGTDAGDGVHCEGTCTLENVWWEDVGEDAATSRGESSSQVMTIDGGGAKGADDKVFQHNGAGTVVIKNFQVEDFGKLYRSCGNCDTPHERHVVLDNVQATAPGKSLVGINSNFGDTATISNVTVIGDDGLTICEEYEGVTDGEPEKIGDGPSEACGYSESDITYE